MEKIKLVIAIPTYKRAGYLALLLDSIKRALQLYPNPKIDLKLCISDNDPAASAAGVVGAHSLTNIIYYSVNSENIGAERNYERLLTLSLDHGPDYVWSIMDDDIVGPRVFQNVFSERLMLIRPEVLYISSQTIGWLPNDDVRVLGPYGVDDLVREVKSLIGFNSMITLRADRLRYAMKNRELIAGTKFWYLMSLALEAIGSGSAMVASYHGVYFRPNNSSITVVTDGQVADFLKVLSHYVKGDTLAWMSSYMLWHDLLPVYSKKIGFLGGLGAYRKLAKVLRPILGISFYYHSLMFVILLGAACIVRSLGFKKWLVGPFHIVTSRLFSPRVSR